MAELPAIAITSPPNGSSTDESPISVSGSASHPAGIATVELRVNGGEWSDATVEFFGDWSGEVDLSSGANAIDAKATSNTSQSRTVSIGVTYDTASFVGEHGVHWRGTSGAPGQDWTGIGW